MKVFNAFALALPLLAAAAFSPLSALAMSSSTPEDTTSAAPLADKPATKAQKMEKNDADAARTFANAALEDILSGMKTNDHVLFCRNLTDEMKVSINKDNFKKMMEVFNEKHGPYKNRVYLGELSQGFLYVYLWKAQFAPVVKKDNKEEPIQNDTLITMNVGKVDGKFLVFGIWFQP